MLRPINEEIERPGVYFLESKKQDKFQSVGSREIGLGIRGLKERATERDWQEFNVNCVDNGTKTF